MDLSKHLKTAADRPTTNVLFVSAHRSAQDAEVSLEGLPAVAAEGVEQAAVGHEPAGPTEYVEPMLRFQARGYDAEGARLGAHV